MPIVIASTSNDSSRQKNSITLSRKDTIDLQVLSGHSTPTNSHPAPWAGARKPMRCRVSGRAAARTHRPGHRSQAALSSPRATPAIWAVHNPPRNPARLRASRPDRRAAWRGANPSTPATAGPAPHAIASPCGKRDRGSRGKHLRQHLIGTQHSRNSFARRYQPYNRCPIATRC